MDSQFNTELKYNFNIQFNKIKKNHWMTDQVNSQPVTDQIMWYINNNNNLFQFNDKNDKCYC